MAHWWAGPAWTPDPLPPLFATLSSVRDPLGVVDMLALLTSIHILVAIVLILIVLVQSAKGTDVGSAFGGMGSQAAFGPRGTATFLSKATIGLAAAFMVTSIALSIMASRAT